MSKIKKCKPVWGSCNLPSGHKGQHNAQAKWPPVTASEVAMKEQK